MNTNYQALAGPGHQMLPDQDKHSLSCWIGLCCKPSGILDTSRQSVSPGPRFHLHRLGDDSGLMDAAWLWYRHISSN